MSQRSPKPPASRTIGVDTGGTFTDVVLCESGEVRFAKLPSTPDDPSRAVLAGLDRLEGRRAGTSVIHGTTVALNALLTRRLARTALVTNRGFADLIEIGRQDRPELYALHPVKPEPLVPRELCFEVASRAWPDPLRPGRLLSVVEPDARELKRLARAVERSRPESIAVCLLHSYADPRIEEVVARALAPLGVPLTLSAHIHPEHREVERFSTAVVNAALEPCLRSYLTALQRAIAPARLSILQSNGGALSAEVAARAPVRVLLSGPAGGVQGAARAARQAGFERMVAFDMGGTSTDVAFHGAAQRLQGTARTLGGAIVATPTLDIHTIGCGGGSLVSIDAGGALRVGPESAGAEPGPVCYGQSDRLTVTDAHALLGHLDSGAFLGGALVLDQRAVARAFERLARRLGVKPVAAAQGVLVLARAAMRRALGVMTMQRGEDPARVPLVAFGGAGGLHGVDLAQSLGSPGVLAPRHAGLLSAWGMALAESVHEEVEGRIRSIGSLRAGELERATRRLARRAQRALIDEGHAPRTIECCASLDLRYAGQSCEIGLPLGRDPAADFERAHARLYGHRLESREIELVALRVRAVAVRGRETGALRVRASQRPVPVRGERKLVFAGSRRPVSARVVDHAGLSPGMHFQGPAVVEDFSGTVLVPPGRTAEVTGGGHLWIASA